MKKEETVPPPLHWQGSTQILLFLSCRRYQRILKYIIQVLPTTEKIKVSVVVERNIYEY
jgi:hypothetical protein